MNWFLVVTGGFVGSITDCSCEGGKKKSCISIPNAYICKVYCPRFQTYLVFVTLSGKLITPTKHSATTEHLHTTLRFVHRRRIKTERRKGKGRRFCFFFGGGEFIQFLAALAILPEDNFEEYDEFILFFPIILVQFILSFKIVL